jgi:hypothetical protein
MCRRIKVQSQPKNILQKKGWLKVVDPEFEPQY